SPYQSPVAMPDRGLVLDLVIFGQPGLLEARCFFIHQPRMRPEVGDAVRRVPGQFGESVVDFDDGPSAISDEESLLQGIHHRVAELVAIGEILGAGPLLLVTFCAVEESACRDVERGQRLQQECQRHRPVEAGKLHHQPVVKLRVFLDDLQHADVVVQCPAAELMTDREVFLVAGLEVTSQRSRVCSVEIVVCHPDTPRCRAVSTSASSLSLAWPSRIGAAIARAGAAKSMSSRWFSSMPSLVMTSKSPGRIGKSCDTTTSGTRYPPSPPGRRTQDAPC